VVVVERGLGVEEPLSRNYGLSTEKRSYYRERRCGNLCSTAEDILTMTIDLTMDSVKL